MRCACAGICVWRFGPWVAVWHFAWEFRFGGARLGWALPVANAVCRSRRNACRQRAIRHPIVRQLMFTVYTSKLARPLLVENRDVLEVDHLTLEQVSPLLSCGALR